MPSNIASLVHASQRTSRPEERAFEAVFEAKEISRFEGEGGPPDPLTAPRLTICEAEMKVSVVDLDLLVRQVIQTYPELHARNGRIEIQGLLPKVLGHPAVISQCLSNVLTNAVKFVAAGISPRVLVRAVSLRSHVRVWVEDNGIGIDPRDHKRIFRMFERVSNDYEGTGLGLATVRRNIARLEGNVGVDSNLGNGSKFWLEFKRI
jgi:signal transduction histidine kinase